MSTQQAELINNVRRTLIESGYDTSKGFRSKGSSFDLTARRDRLLFIKCLLNVDNFQDRQTNELKLISNMFTGHPLLIGERNKERDIAKGVIYKKSGIPILNINTFRDIIEHNLFPFIESRRGGKFVKINAKEFEKQRGEKEFSLTELADKVGVSRKTIYSYEQGKMDASLKVYQELKKFLKEGFERPIDIFSWRYIVDKEYLESAMLALDELHGEINEILMKFGFQVFWQKKALFDAITTEGQELFEIKPEIFQGMKIITGLISKNEKQKQIYQKSQQIDSISQVTQAPNLVITEEKVSIRNAGNVLMIDKNKLEKIEDKKQLYKRIVKSK